MADFLDLTHNAPGPDPHSLPNGSSPRGGEPEGKSLVDWLAIGLVALMAGFCFVAWMVLFCLLAVVT